MSERETAEQRRARRASTWRGGVTKSFAEMEEADWEFWQAMTPEARLRSIWSIVEETLALQGHDGPTPRLQRSIGGVRPRKG
jgi:hypothetical protein